MSTIAGMLIITLSAITTLYIILRVLGLVGG